jgi:hypothetical protein
MPNPQGAHPLPRPRRSAPAKLKLVKWVDAGGCAPPIGVKTTLTSQVESFSRIAGELPPLFLRHWEELALNRDSIPLDPDWDRMFMLEAQGILHVTTARADGVLVGYIFNIVTRHLHYKSNLFAEIDMFWLDPSYRGTWFWLRWFKDNQRMLDKLGVKHVHVGIKNHFMAGRVGNIFRRLGYKPVETMWAK